MLVGGPSEAAKKVDTGGNKDSDEDGAHNDSGNLTRTKTETITKRTTTDLATFGDRTCDPSSCNDEESRAEAKGLRNGAREIGVGKI